MLRIQPPKRSQHTLSRLRHCLRDGKHAIEPTFPPFLNDANGVDEQGTRGRRVQRRLAERPSFITGNGQSVEVSNESIVEPSKITERGMWRCTERRPATIQNCCIVDVLLYYCLDYRHDLTGVVSGSAPIPIFDAQTYGNHFDCPTFGNRSTGNGNSDRQRERPHSATRRRRYIAGRIIDAKSNSRLRQVVPSYCCTILLPNANNRSPITRSEAWMPVAKGTSLSPSRTNNSSR